MTGTAGKRAETQARDILRLVPQLAMGFKSLLGGLPTDSFPMGRPNPRQLSMLMSLSAIGPASVSDIAVRMNLSLTHASQIVGELATAGLAERREDENDRRRTIVSVAPETASLLESIAETAARPLTDFCASLPTEEAEQFIVNLTGLISHLGAEKVDIPR